MKHSWNTQKSLWNQVTFCSSTRQIRITNLNPLRNLRRKIFRHYNSYWNSKCDCTLTQIFSFFLLNKSFNVSFSRISFGDRNHFASECKKNSGERKRNFFFLVCKHFARDCKVPHEIAYILQANAHFFWRWQTFCKRTQFFLGDQKHFASERKLRGSVEVRSPTMHETESFKCFKSTWLLI